MAMPQYRNPVIPGFHPDPSICHVDGVFYLVTSSFEYFPGIPLFRSVDLVHWTQIGHVLDRPSQLRLAAAADSGGVFAPTIRHHDGRFYVTATNVSDRGHFIVSTDDPAGDWSEPVWVDQNGIDPSLSFIDGRVLFQSNVEPSPGSGPHALTPDFTRGIQQSEIDLVTGEILSGPEFIWAGSGGRFPEGPHLYRRGDWYYLVAAEGGTEWGHIATVARARSPWGPFEASPHGPILDHRSAVSPFQAVGHADLVELDDGSWWAVCLGIRPEGGWPHHLIGRETLLAPVTWTDDGWPVVGTGGVVQETHDAPLPHLHRRTEAAARLSSDRPAPDPAWVTVRAPLDGSAWTAEPGRLVLRPGGADPTGALPCFVGRRQEHKSFRARTRVRVDHRDTSLRAGLIVRMNSDHWLALAAARGPSGALELELELEQRIGALRVVTPLGPVRGDVVRLEVEATPREYRFSVLGADGEALHAPPVAARLISTEMAGGFTGAFVGMFADGDPSGRASAVFDLLAYEPGAESGSQDVGADGRVAAEGTALLQPERV